VAAGDRREVVLLAGVGYAAVEPDYLGLGVGPGHHPYLDLESETTASVDMLRSTQVVASRAHRRLEPTIMVTGFSQGGQAAMALARALQQGAGPHLHLGAVAASPPRLFTRSFLRRLAHPRGEILRLVRADDTTCTSWVPHVPARLYAASGDTQVAYLNSVHCQRVLAAHGRHVSLIDVGNVDHFPSEHRALPRALRWFERLQPA